ncbi:hypothetical protein R1flu_002031 [Riccia fluitans]|uniref:Uncharacterized protein n=1 Tax=Riccia fluitans TaxID=41844 RepID=A0ABD1Y5C9_9MARC
MDSSAISTLQNVESDGGGASWRSPLPGSHKSTRHLPALALGFFILSWETEVEGEEPRREALLARGGERSATLLSADWTHLRSIGTSLLVLLSTRSG